MPARRTDLPLTSRVAAERPSLSGESGPAVDLSHRRTTLADERAPDLV